MPQVINTNIASLNAQRALDKSQSSLQTSLQRLSSGLRINSAKDDAAGLAIVDRFTSQIRGLSQGIRNANDGLSVAQVAEGAMQESANILQRMRELAIQSVNDSNSDTDRANIQKEVSQLQAEINRIADTTTFNGKNLLDGSFLTQSFQVGSNANETITVSVNSVRATDLGAYQTLPGDTVDNVGTALAAVATATGVGNGVDGDTIALVGTLGTASPTYAADATAAEIASAVNALQGSTGVTASAETAVTLDAFATGAIGFTLSAEDGSGVVQGTAVSILASVTSATDLAALRDAINAETASTSITALVNAAGTGLDLTNSNGDNIIIESATNNDGADTAALFDVGGATLADSDLLLAGGVTDSIVVGGEITLQSSATFLITVTDADVFTATSISSTLSSVDAIDVSTSTGASDALAVLDEALATITDNRANLGAIQNRLESTISNLASIVENVSAARSRVQDADFASETANLTRNQILQQAGISVLAQANTLPQQVLSLLQ